MWTVKSGSYGQSPGTREALGVSSGFCRVSPDCRKVNQSSTACPDEGHPRGGISPKRSSIKSGTEVAFALVQVGDLLGADIGPRGRDRMETEVGQSSGVQMNRWIRRA